MEICTADIRCPSMSITIIWIQIQLSKWLSLPSNIITRFYNLSAWKFKSKSNTQFDWSTWPKLIWEDLQIFNYLQARNYWEIRIVVSSSNNYIITIICWYVSQFIMVELPLYGRIWRDQRAFYINSTLKMYVFWNLLSAICHSSNALMISPDRCYADMSSISL